MGSATIMTIRFQLVSASAGGHFCTSRSAAAMSAQPGGADEEAASSSEDSTALSYVLSHSSTIFAAASAVVGFCTLSASTASKTHGRLSPPNLKPIGRSSSASNVASG